MVLSNNIMIINFSVNFKEYEEKILNNYSTLTYICPKCGAKHYFIRHGSYTRNFCFINNDGSMCEEKICILRLKCTSCGSTHAVLPNDIVPYCIYSYSTMLNILIRHYINKESVLSICVDLSISFQLIYSFISRFLEFADSCFLVLKNLGFFEVENVAEELIKNIVKYEVDNNFVKEYFFNTNWIFLMKKLHVFLSLLIFIGGTG